MRTVASRYGAWLSALALAMAAPGGAQGSLPPAPYANVQLADPRAEAEARSLMAELRCLTCQSQSIADSDAAMAGDMRHEVRTRIAAGESTASIRDSMIERYGDYITYAPRPSAVNWPLFAAPVLLLVAGMLMWGRRVRRRA